MRNGEFCRNILQVKQKYISSGTRRIVSSGIVQALCCDTTASNTGRLKGICMMLEQLLGCDILYYRLHIYEIILRAVLDEKFMVTSDSDVQIFK